MLRDFLYISETKVDLYFPQIPESFFHRLSKEIGIDLGFFSAGIKHESNKQEKTVVERLLVLDKFLRKKETVGTFAHPKHFVLDDCILFWRVVDSWPSSSLAYFCGRKSDGTEVALGGSSWHLMGGRRPESASVSASEFGYLLGIIENFQGSAKLLEPETEDFQSIRSTRTLPQQLMTARHYLAKNSAGGSFHTRSLSITIDFDRGAFLGTPLYIERV